MKQPIMGIANLSIVRTKIPTPQATGTVTLNVRGKKPLLLTFTFVTAGPNPALEIKEGDQVMFTATRETLSGRTPYPSERIALIYRTCVDVIMRASLEMQPLFVDVSAKAMNVTENGPEVVVIKIRPQQITNTMSLDKNYPIAFADEETVNTIFLS